MLLVLLAVAPTILFFAAALLVVGLLSRNYREANSYVTPVMLLSLAPMAVVLTEPATTPGLLVLPTVSAAVIIRDVLLGQTNWGNFALALASSTLYAGLLLSLAARLFRTEDLVNPAWEPLSVKGFGRGGGASRPLRLPAIDEALFLFAVSLVLLLFVLPPVALRLRLELVSTLALVQAGAFVLPALAVRPPAALAMARHLCHAPAPAPALLGAALMGLGLPWVLMLCRDCKAACCRRTRIWRAALPGADPVARRTPRADGRRRRAYRSGHGRGCCFAGRSKRPWHGGCRVGRPSGWSRCCSAPSTVMLRACCRSRWSACCSAGWCGAAARFGRPSCFTSCTMPPS
jgi:hypothetical protein